MPAHLIYERSSSAIPPSPHDGLLATSHAHKAFLRPVHVVSPSPSGSERSELTESPHRPPYRAIAQRHCRPNSEDMNIYARPSSRICNKRNGTNQETYKVNPALIPRRGPITSITSWPHPAQSHYPWRTPRRISPSRPTRLLSMASAQSHYPFTSHRQKSRVATTPCTPNKLNLQMVPTHSQRYA